MQIEKWRALIGVAPERIVKHASSFYSAYRGENRYAVGRGVVLYTVTPAGIQLKSEYLPNFAREQFENDWHTLWNGDGSARPLPIFDWTDTSWRSPFFAAYLPAIERYQYMLWFPGLDIARGTLAFSCERITQIYRNFLRQLAELQADDDHQINIMEDLVWRTAKMSKNGLYRFHLQPCPYCEALVKHPLHTDYHWLTHTLSPQLAKAFGFQYDTGRDRLVDSELENDDAKINKKHFFRGQWD